MWRLLVHLTVVVSLMKTDVFKAMSFSLQFMDCISVTIIE